MPLFPELRPYLEDAYTLAAPGATWFVERYRSSEANLRTQLLRIIEKAGLDAWLKVFHNMRASRQTELTAKFPVHVVCAWLGNSPTTANNHYLQVTEQDFERAAKSDAALVQRAAYSGTVDGGKPREDSDTG